MDEAQSLKTLIRIEKLLESALAIGKQDQLEERNSARRKVGKKDDGVDFTAVNKQIIRATVRMKMLADEADKLGKTTRNTRADLVGLRSGIRSATSTTKAAFSSLNSTVESIANSMAVVDIERHQRDVTETGNTLAEMSQSALIASNSLDLLTRTARGLNSAFERVASTVVRTSVVTADAARTETTVRTEAADATESATEATRSNTRETNRASSFFSGMLSRFGIRIRDAGDSAEYLKSQLINLGWALSDAAIDITRDIYSLQARGIAAFDGSLIELYGNAMKAGMSLQEYTALLQENSAAVVRAGSFSEFGDSIDRTTRQLNRLGIFGPAAENLAASMRTSAVTVGVSSEMQEASARSQVKIFEQLRKSTLMTAEAFRELQADIANNQMVQDELLALAPRERAARLEQITQASTMGYQLGATAQASKRLTDAILAQRGATVKDRFKAAGTIRMGGAVLGMDTTRAEEYARIMLKNPAARTKEETQRMAELAGDYQQFLQALKSSPNPALENIADELASLAPQVQSELQGAAGAVKAQVEAGAVANADIGKTTSPLMQSVGQALTALSGFMKNPLADSMVILTGILAQSVAQVFMLERIRRAIERNNDTTPPAPAGARRGRGAGRGGMLAGFGAFFAETLGSIASIDITGRRQPGEIRERGIGARISAQNEARAAEQAAKAARVARGDTLLTRVLTPIFGNMFGLSALNNLNFNANGDLIPAETQKGVVSKLGDGLKSVAGKIFGIFKTAGPFSILFGAIEEAFTGDMAAALGFGDGIGGRLLGVVVGGLNSFFTGLTRMFDGGINWVLEGLGFGFRSNLTKLFDMMTITMTMGVKTIMSSFARVFSDIIGFFNKDAPWAKSLREFSDRQDADVVKQAETLKNLWNTEGATLRSMGEEHLRAQKEVADKSKQLTRATTDNVVYGVENLLGTARATAATMQVKPGTAQPTAIATPQPTAQPQVTPPEVNRAQVEDRKKGTGADIQTVTTIAGMQELITNAQQQLDVMKQLLAATVAKQPDGDSKLAELVRPSFADNAALYNTIIAA